MVVAVMMDVKPQTQRIQMIKPHRQCLQTEMLPSDHTAKEDASERINPQRRRPQRTEPQKTRPQRTEPRISHFGIRHGTS
jgi:hypothetical protein